MMTEFMELKEFANANGLRHVLAEIERIVDNWERLANETGRSRNQSWQMQIA